MRKNIYNSSGNGPNNVSNICRKWRYFKWELMTVFYFIFVFIHALKHTRTRTHIHTHVSKTYQNDLDLWKTGPAERLRSSSIYTDGTVLEKAIGTRKDLRKCFSVFDSLVSICILWPSVIKFPFRPIYLDLYPTTTLPQQMKINIWSKNKRKLAEESLEFV